MEGYKREFIQFLQEAGVLKFGDFTAKSGRKIPYFINAGMIKTGNDIARLGEFYAKAYFENEITLPLHTCLTNEDVAYVIEQYAAVIKEYIK